MPSASTPSARRRPSRWPLLLSLALLAGALATLFWLRGRLDEQGRSSLAAAVEVFESAGVLGRPESATINFADVESLAQAIAGRGVVQELRVTKATIARGEVTVAPFHADLTDPLWRADPSWLRLPVGEPAAGWLYFRIDRSNIQAVDQALVVFLAVFALGLAALVFRQRAKEVELVRTVSELEERRAEVIRLERLALAGQLSANILHDIRKPVLNIKHEVQDMLDGSIEATPESLRALHRQTDLFLTILREIGIEDFVREGGERPEWCDAEDIARRALRLVRYEQRGTRAEVVAEGGLPLVFAPPHRLLQLVSNLVLNAFQALKGGGLVRIRLGREGEALLLRVEDDGPGVRPELRTRLFEAFATGRAGEGGSGLGLYICRRIASDLGGSIALDTSALGGAAFVVRIPAGAGPTADQLPAGGG